MMYGSNHAISCVIEHIVIESGDVFVPKQNVCALKGEILPFY